MPPTLVLREYSPDVSTWAIASNNTSQIREGSSSLDPSAVAFVVPLVLAICILTVLVISCTSQNIILYRHPLRQNPTVRPTARSNKAAVRAERKERIGQQLESEIFSSWRVRQLEILKTRAAFPTQVVCVVCLAEFEENDLVRDLECGHVFHVDCLDEWYSRGHDQCPLCKSNLCHSDTSEVTCGQIDIF